MKKLLKFIKKHKVLTLFIVLLIALAVIAFFPSKEKEEEAEEDEETTEQTITEDMTSPDVKDATDINSVVEDGIYKNAAFGYYFTVPDGYKVYEGQDIIYLRDEKTYTQIAIFLCTGSYTSPINVWEQCNSLIYRMTGICENSVGGVSEKEVKNYGTELKKEREVGTFTVMQEEGSLWLRNTGESKDVDVTEEGYFTQYNDYGLMLISYSQKLDGDEVCSVADSILTSWGTYEPDRSLKEFEKYVSGGVDGMQFKYPADFTQTKEDGVIIIKAPNTQTVPYYGCVIEYIPDYNNDYVDDYAQFANGCENVFIQPTFLKEVSTDHFSLETYVTKMDTEKKLGKKDCIYFEITDRVFPASRASQNCLGINHGTIYSTRYTFEAGGVDCVLNIITPQGDFTDFINSVISSVQCN